MTILLLGGRGKTAIRLAELLGNATIPFLMASRSEPGTTPWNQCYFDWEDESSYSKPFSKAGVDGLTPISSVYIVAPPVLDIIPRVIKFIDSSRAHGIKRIVFVSASILEKGGEQMGQVHEYLHSLSGELEWSVLRPTWFMENFSTEPRFINSIKDKRTIITSAGDGKVPFVSVEDIARVAFRCLTDKTSTLNTDYIIVGPESISHSQVAEILTRTLGYEVTHVSLPASDLISHLINEVGMDEEWAQMTADMDEQIIKPGFEDRSNNVVNDLTGTMPETFKSFAERSKGVWI